KPTASPVIGDKQAVELYDFARDVQAQLDSKMSLLQLLLRAADEKIARLESLTQRSGEQRNAAMAAPHFLHPSDGRRPHANPEAAWGYSAVFAMADAGHNCAAIANRLGEPIAEIELILSLRGKSA